MSVSSLGSLVNIAPKCQIGEKASRPNGQRPKTAENGGADPIDGHACDICGSGSQYIGKLENLRGNSDYREKYADKPVVLLAVFLAVGIQASVSGHK